VARSGETGCTSVLNFPPISCEMHPARHKAADFYMDLSDILSPGNILPEIQAADRWEAIDELIANLVRTARIKPEHSEAVTAAVKKRENSMSTGIGFGIGLPHASTDLISDVVGALGRSRKGCNFDALDNQPVSLIMLFLVPQGQFQKHLHTLANIAKLMHKADFRQALEQAADANAMMEVIKQYGKK
jgi:mannitol/fructose-specific phosphotransferase system IIA component (Ntr-type)